MSVESDVKEKLENLMQWFKTNPKLPQDINPTLLKRFLKCTDMNVEETKNLLERNYYLRSKNPNIFIDRDPNNEVTKKSYLTVEIVPLPGLTPDNYKIVCFRLANKDARAHNSIEESKCFFMTADTRFTYSDLNDQAEDTAENGKDVDMASLANGEIHVVDISNYTVRYLASMSLMVMRTYMNFMQDAYPVRLKAMHIINCPSYLNRLIAIAKPFIREEVFKLFHFHTAGIESLYEHVPRDMLPAEFGGKGSCMSKLSTDWWNIVLKKREYLMDQNHWQLPKTTNRSLWSWW